jgi:hypothetical protein
MRLKSELYAKEQDDTIDKIIQIALPISTKYLIMP